jgi:molecular chaperone GrpE
MSDLSSPAPETDLAGALAALRESLAQLERQVGKAGKEQFKANALAEAQQKTLEGALEQLRAALATREQEANAWREQVAMARTRERLEVIRALLPVLDGLHEALASGQRLLDLQPAEPSGLVQRARLAWEVLLSREPPAAGGRRLALEAWLIGLGHVQARLLALLAAEGVRPIAAEGEFFDPHWHVALEIAPADVAHPPGRITRELRRGYRRGPDILRYAEVAVAKEAATAPATEAA